MINLNFKWVRQTSQYSNGEDLFLNKIPIGSISWNSCMSKDDHDKEKKQYVGNCMLYPSSRWYGSDNEMVKRVIEQKITAWFNEALKSEE